MKRLLILGHSLLAAMLVAACAATGVSTNSGSSGATAAYQTMTKERQVSTTPDGALTMLKQGNVRFTGNSMITRDLKKQVKETGYAQYPFASVVSCIDSRAAPELVFDQGIGDIFSPRVAGNFVNEDILGSLEFASKIAGSKLIVVLGHTSCGAIKGACDDAKLGNLTSLLDKIKPAVSSVQYSGDRSSKNGEFVELVSAANVKATVNDILKRSAVLKEMSDKGQIKIVGAMLDVKTGAVTFY